MGRRLAWRGLLGLLCHDFTGSEGMGCMRSTVVATENKVGLDYKCSEESSTGIVIGTERKLSKIIWYWEEISKIIWLEMRLGGEALVLSTWPLVAEILIIDSQIKRCWGEDGLWRRRREGRCKGWPAGRNDLLLLTDYWSRCLAAMVSVDLLKIKIWELEG